MGRALFLVIALAGASCSLCDGEQGRDRGRRADRSDDGGVDRPHPRLRDLPIEPFWDRDGGACPDGGELAGSPPPGGDQIRCELDGRPHGLYAAWHRGGGLWKSGSFQKGRRDGTWTFWSPSGTKVREHTLASGKLDGKAVRWSSSGAPVEERTYRRGKLQKAVYFEGGEAVDVTAREQAADRCRSGDQSSCEQACEGLSSPSAGAPDGGTLPSRLRGDGALSLLDATMPSKIDLGDTFEMEIRFLVEEPTTRPWKVSVVFEGTEGGRFSADHDPQCPTTRWPAGTIVTDRFWVIADDDLSAPRAGTYRALVGLFGVVDGEWQTLAPDRADSAWRVSVGEVRVRQDRRQTR